MRFFRGSFVRFFRGSFLRFLKDTLQIGRYIHTYLHTYLRHSTATYSSHPLVLYSCSTTRLVESTHQGNSWELWSSALHHSQFWQRWGRIYVMDNWISWRWVLACLKVSRVGRRTVGHFLKSTVQSVLSFKWKVRCLELFAAKGPTCYHHLNHYSRLTILLVVLDDTVLVDSECISTPQIQIGWSCAHKLVL